MDEFGWFFKNGFIFDAGSKELTKILKLLDEVPFPLPVVIGFSSQGVIEVLLTKPLQTPTRSDMPEFIETFHRDGYLRLSLLLSDNHPTIVGKPVYDSQYFENHEDAGRLLEEQVGAEEVLAEEETAARRIEDMSFNWTITSYNSTRIFIQLNFSDPEFVSLDLIDKLDFEYMEPAQFLIYALNEARAPENPFAQELFVPKQFSEEFERGLAQFTGSTSGVV